MFQEKCKVYAELLVLVSNHITVINYFVQSNVPTLRICDAYLFSWWHWHDFFFMLLSKW